MGDQQAAAKSQPASDISLDPAREAASAGIRILDRAEGGREFILPATRNFSEKRSFSICWLFVTAFLVGLPFFQTFINDLPFPGVVRFFLLNHILYFWEFSALIGLVLTIAVVDMWLAFGHRRGCRQRADRDLSLADSLNAAVHWNTAQKKRYYRDTH